MFDLKVEKTFDLSCLPEDDENVFETCEIVQLRDKSFAKFLISLAVRELDQNLLGIRLSSSGGSCRKLFTV